MEDKNIEKFTTLFFPEEIERDTTKEFISQLTMALNEFDKVYIYYTCAGGSGPDARIICDMINRNKDKIKLILSWQIASAAVDIVIDAECDISILDDVFMGIHLSTRDIDYRERLKGDPIEVFVENDLLKVNDKLIRKYKAFFNLSAEEVKLVETGNDLFLDNDRVVDAMTKKGTVWLSYLQQ